MIDLDRAPGEAGAGRHGGRNEGRVLITSSIGSTMPGSFQPVYEGTKSFLQSFAEAVANESKTPA